jgi:NTE family protein
MMIGGRAIGSSELLEFLHSVPMLAEVPAGDLENLFQAAEIVRVQGGETLVRQGDSAAEGLFIVIHGRLRASLRMPSGEVRILGEIRRRDVIGEMAVLTGAQRSATIVAVRDSLLVRLGMDSRRLIENPQLLLALARVVVGRANAAAAVARPEEDGMVLSLLASSCTENDLQSAGHNLLESLRCHGKTIRLNGADAASRLGRSICEENTESLINWLSELEERTSFIILQADREDTPWTRFCRRQADRLLLVADGDQEAPAAHGVDTLLRTCLLLLHDPAKQLPSRTRQFQLARGEALDIWHIRRERAADWQRVARLVTGRATGLALSGGGARGFAHLGVLRAMAELDLPIDVFGGTSFGAIVAALAAMEMNWRDIHKIFIEVFVDNPPQRDYTFPIVAIGAGRKLTKALHRLFGESEIEDLWRPFLCMSTNISKAVPVMHMSGPLTKWVRASLSLPGLAPPVIHHGEIFVDGCIFNNLPVDVVKQRWPCNVVAVDVADEKNMTTSMTHMDVVSGWGVLLHKIIPFLKPYDLPSFPELLQRASIVASTQALARARGLAAVYLQPPVSGVNVLDWGQHNSLVEAGYRTALQPLTDWRELSGPRLSRSKLPLP